MGGYSIKSYYINNLYQNSDRPFLHKTATLNLFSYKVKVKIQSPVMNMKTKVPRSMDCNLVLLLGKVRCYIQLSGVIAVVKKK